MRPSTSLENNRSQVREVLQRFGVTNPRVFGSAARGEDTDRSDLDIMVDAPPGTSLYDLAAIEVELETILGCKVEVLTKGFPHAAARAELDLLPISRANDRSPNGWMTSFHGASGWKAMSPA